MDGSERSYQVLTCLLSGEYFGKALLGWVGTKNFHLCLFGQPTLFITFSWTYSSLGSVEQPSCMNWILNSQNLSRDRQELKLLRSLNYRIGFIKAIKTFRQNRYRGQKRKNFFS